MRLKQASLSLLAMLALAATCFADSQARIVRLSYLEGNVQLDRGDGNGYTRAFLNMPLIEGASVWTKEDGRAEVEFEDGSTVRLTPDTILHFGELRLRDDGSKATGLDLKDGTAYFEVRQRDEDSFRVNVNGRELTLEKNSEFRVVHELQQQSDLKISVFKGELRFLNPDGQRVAIKKNETLSLEFDDSGRYFLARGISEEPHDYWNRERDQDREVLAARQNSGVYTADLYRYGSFFTVAGFGQVWRPFSVGFGWDPFGSGSWVYYPGAGFVWVSDYIWGWTPYRYGSWVHVGNHGWCWRPSPRHGGWNPGPIVVNPPSGYVGPVVPPGNPRTPIIRVGRGFDAIDPRDDRRRDNADAPIGIIQDRVRGVRQVDARMPIRRATPPAGDGRPVDVIGDRRVRDRDDENRDRPGDRRGDTRLPQSRPVDNVKRQREIGIDAQRETEEPVRMTPPPPSVSPKPTQPTTPVQPIIQDRPMRTPRDSSPPPPPIRVSPPPERQSPPPQVAPSNPAPRVSPPPPPPPSRSAPVRDGIKDQ